jgi:hypothetical protein
MDLSAKICRGTEARFRPDPDTIPEIRVAIHAIASVSLSLSLCVRACVCGTRASIIVEGSARDDWIAARLEARNYQLTLTCPICRISLKLKKYAKISDM